MSGDDACLVIEGSDENRRAVRTMKGKKRQQEAQSHQANARHKEQEREARNVYLAESAEKRFSMPQVSGFSGKTFPGQ